MGTRGYLAYRYKGKYYREYVPCDAYPQAFGLDWLGMIPRDSKALKKWMEKVSKRLEIQHQESPEQEDEEVCTDSNWTLGEGDVQWTYVIDLDNHVFTVNGLLHFKFKSLPPFRTSGSKIGFADYFSEYHEPPFPKIPAKHLTSLEFWPKFTFDAERTQQEYATLQPTVATLSEWNAPTWNTLSVAQHLSASLIRTLVYDYSDELALCSYSSTWVKLGAFCWNVANAAATSHLLCPPSDALPTPNTSYVLNIGYPEDRILTSPHPTTCYYIRHKKFQDRFYWFRGCLITFGLRLGEPTYMTHKIVQMVQTLRRNNRAQGVGIIISGWHVVAVTVDGSDVCHSPALELHDGKELKDGSLLLMHLLSPTLTRSKAPWLTPLQAQPHGDRPNLPDEVLRHIIYFTDFETYIRISKVSRYFRSIYLAQPRIGNYTLLSYEGVTLSSEPKFIVRGRGSTDLATLKRVKVSMDPSRKAFLVYKYDYDYNITEPILQTGLAGMFQYHRAGTKRSDHIPTDESKKSSTRVALKPMSLRDIVGGKKSPRMRVQALDGVWEMVEVNS